MSITIYAVGDIMLGTQDLCDNFGVKEIIDQKGPKFLFNEISPIFSRGDLVFGNLECTVSEKRSGRKNRPRFFCAEPAAVEALRDAHFNVLSVSNNHIMEHGLDAFQYTIQRLTEVGITPAGVRDTLDILNVKGWRVACLAYSMIDDGNHEPGYRRVRDEQPIIKDIGTARSLADIVIVSIHWGCEYTPYPSPEQIRIGRTFIDAGADIILGGHPHVIQGYEQYRGKPIFFSFGNFIFDDTYISITRKTYIAEIVIDELSGPFVVNIIPVVIDPDDYRPRIPTTTEADCILEDMRKITEHVQGRSLEEYREWIGDYESISRRYKDVAKSQTKNQFIKNMFRYMPSTTCGIVLQYLDKKLRGGH